MSSLDDNNKSYGNSLRHETLLLLARLIAKRHRNMKQEAEGEGAVDNLSNDVAQESNESLS